MPVDVLALGLFSLGLFSALAFLIKSFNASWVLSTLGFSYNLEPYLNPIKAPIAAPSIVHEIISHT